MDGLQVNVTNYSSLSWGLNNWHVGAGSSDEVNWKDEVSQSPAQSLEAYDGTTTAAAHSEHLSSVVQDALYMIVGYGSGKGNFAVKLQQYFHMFGIGPQVSWSWWDDVNKKWTDSTTNASPQTWTLGGLKVLATPSLSASGGSVEIIIQADPK